MQQVTARVRGVSVYEPIPSFYCLRLEAPRLAAGFCPGQFVLVSTEMEYLRRPFFPITLDGDSISVLFRSEAPLRVLVPGDAVDCIGPLGTRFPLRSAANNLLLLAQSEGFGVSQKQNGVTYLLTLVEQALAAGKRVLLVHEAPTAAQLFPPGGLPPGVEIQLATLDGSQGHAGSALELLPELAQWADHVYAVGDVAWYAVLVRVLREHRLHLGQGLAWGLIAPEIMPCGMGACGGCAVERRGGYRLACADGPVFDLTKVS